METKVHIHLNDETIFFSQVTPRMVAGARHEPLQEKPRKMKRSWVIQRIEEQCLEIPEIMAAHPDQQIEAKDI